jgi:hypothetical protein
MYYRCPTCKANHTTQSNIGRCKTCGRTICINCKKPLDLYDACAVVTYENVVDLKNYSTESVILCPSCHAQIEEVVERYKGELVALQSKYQKEFISLRDAYLVEVSKML